jgi:hypothetical protein
MVPDYKPVKVTGSASKGIATDLGCVEETEDTITLLVDWKTCYWCLHSQLDRTTKGGCSQQPILPLHGQQG